MRNPGLEEAQAGIKIARRNINNPRYAHDTTLMAESEEELKSLLMKVKEESEKVDLKLNIQKTKIMASSPITSWEIDGETVETVSDFIWAPKSLQIVIAPVKLKDTYSFPNLEPVPCSMSSSNCRFLTCTQISQEAGKVVWYSRLLKNFPQFVLIHTVKGFSIVNETDVSLEFSCFSYDELMLTI